MASTVVTGRQMQACWRAHVPRLTPWKNHVLVRTIDTVEAVVKSGITSPSLLISVTKWIPPPRNIVETGIHRSHVLNARNIEEVIELFLVTACFGLGSDGRQDTVMWVQ